jgi:transcription elongation regulator 1
MEKNISPFAPWDQSLPTFINDPRYILLSSEKDRREVYEEYCRDVGRARRLNKTSTSVATSASQKADPEKEYKTLLREEVTSTRTRWDDFRKKWKKDRRFYAFGRDDREREKVFKTHLKEVGEREYTLIIWRIASRTWCLGVLSIIRGAGKLHPRQRIRRLHVILTHRQKSGCPPRRA